MCYSLWYNAPIALRAGLPPLPGFQPATLWVHYTTCCNTQSSASEDGRDHRPKHVELIGIINKPLLLHLVRVYIIYGKDDRSNKCQSFDRKFHVFAEIDRAGSLKRLHR